MLDFFKKIAYKLQSAFQRGRRPTGGKKVNIQEPVYVRELFDGKATIIVFGAPFNWNYAGTSREDMEAKNHGITAAIEEVMRKHDIKRALVPKPAFNAKVVTGADLPNELLPNFFRGADADGVILNQPGDAYFLASADCLAAAVFDERTGTLAALHCGRDAVIDRKLINQGKDAAREHGSVVDAAVKQLDGMMRATLQGFFDREPYANEMGWVSGGDEENLYKIYYHSGIQAFLAAGIRPETFDHPQRGDYHVPNGLMIDHLNDFETRTNSRWKNVPFREHQLRKFHPPVVVDVMEGKIDLFALVRRQLDEYNIEQVEEDEFDTATSTDAEGNFLFHSNRRDKTLRNLVVIKLN